jgi:ABC-2 type transport system ATP-binding protein
MLIDARNLVKTFGKLRALIDVSLQVSECEIFGLVGPDGAGKTTTMRLLCGVLRLEGGKAGKSRVSIGGCDLDRQTEQARALIGYLPQRFSLYEELTVLENLRFFAEVRGLPPVEWRPRCMEILAFVGLDDFTSRKAGQLSGGMKQKLGLAAALVHRPKVLILDEPTTGVDPLTRQDFWQLIMHITIENGTAVLVSTPYMDEAARCTRVAFMREGRLLVTGTPAELRSMLEGSVLELAGEPQDVLRQIAKADPGVLDVHKFGDRLHLRILKGTSLQVQERLAERIAAEGMQARHLRPAAVLLEDVFFALVEQQI